MVYLLGVNLPDDKLARIALTRFYGIGQATAAGICDKLGIHRRCKLQDITDEQRVQLAQILGGMTIESELKREIRKRIESEVQIGTVRGARHDAGYPVRGGRTRTNARTARNLKRSWMFGSRTFSTVSWTSFRPRGWDGLSSMWTPLAVR
ncbi:hypothetical protein DFJ74DRAFT_671800 [Hyaloraphidium curvatum]|nr:hypothetical protein DFJ74DRAFT_671800 [Hyaloraphidium curvatum]